MTTETGQVSEAFFNSTLTLMVTQQNSVCSSNLRDRFVKLFTVFKLTGKFHKL